MRLSRRLAGFRLDRGFRVARGFTLVELLVVITIIGLLAALIVPAVSSAIERGRQNTCMNNLRQMGQASINYASSKGYYPGYLNPKLHQSQAQNTSWAVALLNNLDRESLHKAWINNETASINDPNTSKPTYLEIFVCPSDNTAVGQPGPYLSFAVNTGRTGNKDDGSDTWEGISHDISDLSSANMSKTRNRRVAFGGIPDGADVTLLASENLEAELYTSSTEPLLGFQFGSATPYINKSGASGRPSSNHSGVVNVVFAGGNTRSIDELINHEVWNQLMTPNGKKAGTATPLVEGSY